MEPSATLTSPGLVRVAELADAQAIADIYRPYVEESVISFEESTPDADEIRTRMLASPRLPWLVATHDEQRVGFAYASPHRARAAYRWAVDVSLYLSTSEHRRGTGRALYDRLFTHLRDLGYLRAYAGIALPNPASVGLHEAIGFTLIGIYHRVGYKFGGWHDVGWWEFALADDPAPSAPRAWPSA